MKDDDMVANPKKMKEGKGKVYTFIYMYIIYIHICNGSYL